MHAHSWMTKCKPSKGRDNSVHFGDSMGLISVLRYPSRAIAKTALDPVLYSSFGDVGEVVIESRNDVKSSRPEVFIDLPTDANPTINNWLPASA